jgi:hypothetical protein
MHGASLFNLPLLHATDPVNVVFIFSATCCASLSLSDSGRVFDNRGIALLTFHCTSVDSARYEMSN